MKKLLQKSLGLLVIGLSFFIIADNALAAATICPDPGAPSFADESSCNVACTAACIEPSSTTSSSGGTVKLDNPLNTNDPRVIIGNVIKVSLGLVGSLALLLFIYGGLMWMTSAGNADRLKRGLDTLVWAAIGLIVILGSYTIVNFVIQNLPKAGS